MSDHFTIPYVHRNEKGEATLFHYRIHSDGTNDVLDVKANKVYTPDQVQTSIPSHIQKMAPLMTQEAMFEQVLASLAPPLPTYGPQNPM